MEALLRSGSILVSKNIPLFLIGICHGSQEKILFQTLTESYLDAIYAEISSERFNPYKDNPLIRTLSRNRIEKVSISTYKRDVKERFPCDSLHYDIPEIICGNGELLPQAIESLAFITFIDFNEKNQNTLTQENQLLIDDGRLVLEEIMDESNEYWLDKKIIHSSLIIHADGAVERWLPNYVKTNSKLHDMRQWLKINILKLDSMDRKSIRKVIEKIDKDHYNLIDYLDFIDEIFKEYTNGN